jgi:hypothetical protein
MPEYHREECIATLKTLHILDPVAAHACAEAVLLEWLVSRGERDVVQAYLDAVAIESVDIPTGKAP